MPRSRVRFEITGVVQGVGFRPFVYNLAREHALSGFVFNHNSGVTIEAEGVPEALSSFERDLRLRKPPLSIIDRIVTHSIAGIGDSTFMIVTSEHAASGSTPVSPDVATCEDCLRELHDPADRRFAYPFLNCTNCGPRFTIIQDLPYDRPATTMHVFAMCETCLAEYQNPADRRFHAQPNACPKCGPQVTFENRRESLTGPPAIARAREELARGAILAVKGIGGFHLVCDATSDEAIDRLRGRKNRFEQPFAIMVRDLEAARKVAHLPDEESRLLTAKERPIVLLEKRAGNALSERVAPGNGYIGVMLPYSPLHPLLLGEAPLVMTSANPSGEPIVRENREAVERLSGLADAFLLHNRDIEVVCDDSVIRTFEGYEMPLRRSRGYAPLPIQLPKEADSILAVGAELKSTFCITKQKYAYLSQHIGDMGMLETQRAFERALDHMLRLFRVEPRRVVCDLHPGYHSANWAARYAEERKLPLIKVQHHHAHVAALVAESALPLDSPIIGIVFDGTGYGTDGAIWGGEVLIVRGAEFERFAHLKYVPLAGGDAAVKTPARSALSHLHAAKIDWDDDLACVAEFHAPELRLLRQQLDRELNCVRSSSMGRLFDAVSALIGVRQRVSYEGQAAIELESLCATDSEPRYTAKIIQDSPQGSPVLLDPGPMLREIVADLRAGVPRERIGSGFHEAVASWIVAGSELARQSTGLNLVGLTGGVFQNLTLLRKSVTRLRAAGFDVRVHRVVPPNDGGLALGQATLGLLQTPPPA